jgi:DNA end-binding protein Ku
MPRAVWSGSISFGLINVPVKLYSAITEKQVRFNQIDTRNNARIRQQKVNAEDGSEVPTEAIAKGFEISRGQYVIVTEDDLAQVQPRATHTIDLETFVDLDDIDPIYFDGAYHVAPDDRAAKSYALLVAAMEAANKVAVARFVMRSKQYVAVMRPVDGTLLLSMLVYADEINPVSAIPEFDDLGEIDINERELAMAEQLIESLSSDWEPEAFRDTYREELLELIHAKVDGATPAPATAETPAETNVVDLMAALEASVAAAREARGRHPSAGVAPAAARDDGAADDGAAGDESVAQPPDAPRRGRSPGSGRRGGGSRKAPAKRPAAAEPAAAGGRRKAAVSEPAAAKQQSPKRQPSKKTPAKRPAAARKTPARTPAARKSA